MKLLHPASAFSIGLVAMVAAGCSERERSSRSDNVELVAPREMKPEPIRAIFRRNGRQVAHLINDTCLKAVDHSASTQQFAAILKKSGLSPVALPGRGRMSVWQVPGAEIAYTNSGKGEFDQSILCEITFEIRGAPKAAQVAVALKPLLNRGNPERGEDVGPWNQSGYRWKYLDGPGERTVLTIGDMPELHQLELPSIPPNLTFHLSHLEGPRPR